MLSYDGSITKKDPMQKDTLIQAGGRAAATFVYVALVVTLISNGSKLFGEKDDDLLIPIFMLLLFLISATVTSLLILGKPVMMYQAGDKKGAFTFLFATLGWLAAFLLAVGVVMAVR